MSFSSEELFDHVKRDVGPSSGGELLKELVFSSSDVYATVVVQMYMPYLTTEDIALFLGRYCVEVREGGTARFMDGPQTL